MNKLEEVACIFCGAERVYTHENQVLGGWKVYCDKCGGRGGAHDSEEAAVAEYMRVVGMVISTPMEMINDE